RSSKLVASSGRCHDVGHLDGTAQLPELRLFPVIHRYLRLAFQRLARRNGFQTPERTAAALNPGLHHLTVTDLTAEPLPAVEWAAIEHDARAQTRAHVHPDIGAIPLRRPDLAFGNRAGVRDVLHHDRNVQCAADDFAHGNVLPPDIRTQH